MHALENRLFVSVLFDLCRWLCDCFMMRDWFGVVFRRRELLRNCRFGRNLSSKSVLGGFFDTSRLGFVLDHRLRLGGNELRFYNRSRLDRLGGCWR